MGLLVDLDDDRSRYVELVLSCVETVPPGRVTTYGAIAQTLASMGHGGGPRQVAAVMAREGAAVAWWRVVRADGSLPVSLEPAARAEHRSEGTALRPGGRVDLAAAFVAPRFGEPNPTHR